MSRPRRPARTRISISLSGDEKESLERIAKKNEISLARVVRQAILEFLQSPERQLFLFKADSTSSDLDNRTEG
jgi:hypothetical protein